MWMPAASVVSQPPNPGNGKQEMQPLYGTQSGLPTGALQYLQFENVPPLACLSAWLPPFLIQHSLDLRAFIGSDVFTKLRRVGGDKAGMDAMYVYAMRLTNNNTGAALLLAATASFDHRDVAIRNPIFSLAVPLSNESEQEFLQRVSHLPRRLYDDSPASPAGDRDKLQHFFGSAFLTYIMESAASAERFGEFVEKGEEAFIIGGVNDDRDLRADRQGQMFGYTLLSNNKTYPSRFLFNTRTPAGITPARTIRSN